MTEPKQVEIVDKPERLKFWITFAVTAVGMGVLFFFAFSDALTTPPYELAVKEAKDGYVVTEAADGSGWDRMEWAANLATIAFFPIILAGLFLAPRQTIIVTTPSPVYEGQVTLERKGFLGRRKREIVTFTPKPPGSGGWPAYFGPVKPLTMRLTADSLIPDASPTIRTSSPPAAHSRIATTSSVLAQGAAGSTPMAH